MSACKLFFESIGKPENKIKEYDKKSLDKDVFNDGLACMSNNMSYCKNVCLNSTLNSKACYDCLSQPRTCPSSACLQKRPSVDCSLAENKNNECCISKTGSCCPLVELAVECGKCVAKKGSQNDINGYLQCLNPETLSSKSKLWIIVGSVIGAIFLLIIVIIVIRIQYRAKQKREKIEKLKKSGTNIELLKKIENIDLDQIDFSKIP